MESAQLLVCAAVATLGAHMLMQGMSMCTMQGVQCHPHLLGSPTPPPQPQQLPSFRSSCVSSASMAGGLPVSLGGSSEACMVAMLMALAPSCMHSSSAAWGNNAQAHGSRSD